MKRLLITLFAVLLSVICLAQQQVAKVTLKNGTVLTGQVSELDPISHVKLIVGGFETTINMADVASIENVKDEKADKQENVQGQTAIIPEAHDYDGLPELYNLKVGPYVVEMKLIKGTTFSMGYDGDGSMRMDSEPVHDVTLTSFYINTSPLDKDLVGYIKKGKEEHSKRSSVYHPFTRKDAKGVAEKLAETTQLPIDLITEAQWEYVAVNFDSVFAWSSRESNYCYDFYGSYTSSKTPPVDPKGPKSGMRYVKRKLGMFPTSVYTRFDTSEETAPDARAIRITFPAKAIK